jgi:hypothetical protein
MALSEAQVEISAYSDAAKWFSKCFENDYNLFLFYGTQFLKVHKVTRSTDFDEIFKLDTGNVLTMMCAKFEVHTTHRSDDPYEFVKFSQKN